MRATDLAYMVFLGGLAGFIWFRDSGWLQWGQDTWPILAGLPLFYWLGRPWTLRHESPVRPMPAKTLASAGALALAGCIADLNVLLALAWTWFLRIWLQARSEEPALDSRVDRLLVLPFLSFPWIATDLALLGWFFRISGAAMADGVLRLCELNVVRQGTQLWVDDQGISVEAACSGMNGLQSLLIAGTTLACLKLKESPYFWWNLPVLVVAAWAANSLRIVVLALGISQGILNVEVDFAHEAAGGLALCLAFGLCWGLFSLQESKGGFR